MALEIKRYRLKCNQEYSPGFWKILRAPEYTYYLFTKLNFKVNIEALCIQQKKNLPSQTFTIRFFKIYFCLLQFQISSQTYLLYYGNLHFIEYFSSMFLQLTPSIIRIKKFEIRIYFDNELVIINKLLKSD